MQEKLILNDGTEITGYCLKDGTQLTLYMPGKTIAEMCPYLSDQTKTVKIIHKNDGKEYTYNNFTHLFSMMEYPDGMLTAGLKKGA